MTFHELYLAAREKNWRLFMLRKNDKAFIRFEQKIFERDHYTCQFCGFQSRLFQDVVNLDGNYNNNAKENLVTACPFCVQCGFLDAVGLTDFGGGSLIYLPELTQNQLNATCHVIFSALAFGNSYATQAGNLYRSFKLRTQLVEKEFGEGLSSPSLLGRLLIESVTDVSDEFQDAIQNKVRLLPNLSRYVEQLRHWSLEGLTSLV